MYLYDILSMYVVGTMELDCCMHSENGLYTVFTWCVKIYTTLLCTYQIYIQ